MWIGLTIVMTLDWIDDMVFWQLDNAEKADDRRIESFERKTHALEIQQSYVIVVQVSVYKRHDSMCGYKRHDSGARMRDTRHTTYDTMQRKISSSWHLKQEKRKQEHKRV
jgi:hypothetical protein